MYTGLFTGQVVKLDRENNYQKITTVVQIGEKMCKLPGLELAGPDPKCGRPVFLLFNFRIYIPTF